MSTMQYTTEFNDLRDEIAEAEGLTPAEAHARAVSLWGELGPVGEGLSVATDWRFVAWCLALALGVALSVVVAGAWLVLA